MSPFSSSPAPGTRGSRRLPHVGGQLSRDERPPKTGVGRALHGVAIVIVSLLLFFGFIVISSFVAELTANTVLRLFVGVTASIALPLLVAFWSHNRARARGRSGLPTLLVLAIVNSIILLGSGLVAPRQMRSSVERHGAWWMAAMSRDPAHGVALGTQNFLSWLVRWLPPPRGARETPAVAARTSDAGAVRPEEIGQRRDGGARERTQSHARADSGAAGSGEVRVVFERQQGAILVPVQLQGSRGVVSAKMVFDTGASLTTLNEATLLRLGVTLDRDSPTVEVHTANGLVRRPLAIIDGVSLGEARLSGGVTVAVCEPCARGELVGLLGLNVSGQFRVTIDHGAGQLVLQRKSEHSRLNDIQPWVELKDARGLWRGPLLSVDTTVENHASRALRNVRIAAVVRAGKEEGRIVGELRDLPARSRAPLHLQGLPPVRGASFQLRVEHADW